MGVEERDVRRGARLVAPFGACRSSIERVFVSQSSGSAGGRKCVMGLGCLQQGKRGCASRSRIACEQPSRLSKVEAVEV